MNKVMVVSAVFILGACACRSRCGIKQSQAEPSRQAVEQSTFTYKMTNGPALVIQYVPAPAAVKTSGDAKSGGQTKH